MHTAIQMKIKNTYQNFLFLQWFSWYIPTYNFWLLTPENKKIKCQIGTSSSYLIRNFAGFVVNFTIYWQPLPQPLKPYIKGILRFGSIFLWRGGLEIDSVRLNSKFRCSVESVFVTNSTFREMEFSFSEVGEHNFAKTEVGKLDFDFFLNQILRLWKVEFVFLDVFPLNTLNLKPHLVPW